MLEGENKKPVSFLWLRCEPETVDVDNPFSLGRSLLYPPRKEIYKARIQVSVFVTIRLSRLVFCSPCARCVAVVVHGQGAVGRWSCTTRRAIQTRPLPTEVNEEFITVIAVTENRAKPARLAQFSARRREKKPQRRGTRPFRVRGFYSCSFALHHDCDLVVLTCTL